MSIDAQESALGAVQAGDIDAVVAYPIPMPAGIFAGVKVMEGEEIPGYIELECPVITTENVGEYIEMCIRDSLGASLGAYARIEARADYHEGKSEDDNSSVIKRIGPVSYTHLRKKYPSSIRRRSRKRGSRKR